MAGSVRFDLRVPENIQYFPTFSQWNSSIYSHLPDPLAGYRDNTTGSDIINIIFQFLNNTQAPVCGSTILIALKRYPNEKEIAGIVAELQKYHVSIHVISTVDPSGGLYSQTMYDLATRTNGLCFFQLDTKFYQSASFFSGLDASPYLFYSANPTVTGTGSTALAPLTSPHKGYGFILMTVQNNGQLRDANSSFHTIELDWKNSEGHTSMYQNHTTLAGFAWGNYFGDSVLFNATTYNTTLKYAYDTKPQTLQIRIYSHIAIDYWLPYD